MKTPTLLLLSLTLVSQIYALPSAEELLESVQTRPEKTEGETLVEDLEKKLADLELPNDRLNAWLDTYTAVASSSNRKLSWETRKELQLQIPTLGKFFPHRNQWDTLKKQISSRQTEKQDPSLTKLSYLIAILESDTDAAIRILRSNFNEETVGHAEGDTRIQQALSRKVYGTDEKTEQGKAFLEIAFNENSLPTLQRAAYEMWTTLSSDSKNQFYVDIPDLNHLYSKEEVENKIEALAKLMGEDLRVHSLPRAMVGPVVSAYRRLDLPPPEDFIRNLQPDSENYQENLSYLSEKLGEEKFQKTILGSQIENALKQGDIESAWQDWQKLAEADTESASQFVRGLYGWRGRNYPRQTILDFSHKLLPYSENADFLRQVSQLIPLEETENDVILSKIDTLLENEANELESLNLEILKLQRLLAFGAFEEAGAVAMRTLEKKDVLLKTLEGDTYWFNPLRYAQAFRLLEKPEISKAWVDVAIESAKILEGYERRQTYAELMEFALQNGDDTLAFNYATEAFKQASVKESAYDRIWAADPLATLVLLYQKAGQSSDALMLLDQAVGWGVTDLALLNNPLSGDSIHTVVAKALVETDQLEKAKHVLRDHLLYSDNSDDSAYKELVQLEGQAALPFLKQLQAEYPFEERPLIWQAVLALESGKLDLAEANAREAIAIDPTDGEMNANDRLRAYAVLGDILEQKRNMDAVLYQKVVAAVDLAEKADTYRVAGLTSEALKRYDKAMNLFTDAYCVQFRAAVEYEAVGDIKKAEEHFEKAYRLMPNQFGRIESHCFGCEGAFNGERATGIAERVFKGMLEENPKQASLYYLMGYLHKSKGSPEEALSYFKQAVDLDPLYYNSWQHIASITDRGPQFDAELHLTSLRAMLEIAPMRSIHQLESIRISMMGAMWDEIPGYFPLLPKRSKPVYPLTASAEALEASGRNRDDWQEELWENRGAGQILFSNYRIQSFLLNQ